MALAVIASLMLIVAQTSWWASYVLQGDLDGTGFANVLWAIFNSLTMAIFILMAYRRQAK